VYRSHSQHSSLSHHPGSSYSSSELSISNAISSTAQSAFTNSSTANKGVFLGGISIKSKNSYKSDNNNYDRGSGATIPDSARPNRTPAPGVRPLTSPSRVCFTPTCVVLVSFLPWRQSVSKCQLQSEQATFFFLSKIGFAAVRRYTFEFIVLTIWVGRCQVGDVEDDRDDTGGCRSGSAGSRGECV